jgi:hypothetical protein
MTAVTTIPAPPLLRCLFRGEMTGLMAAVPTWLVMNPRIIPRSLGEKIS